MFYFQLSITTNHYVISNNDKQEFLITFKGADGEYYFHPSKGATLKGPVEALSHKQRTIPIFPYTNVLAPLGNDWLNILEMRHRQLLTDVGDGLFGFCYYSQVQQKLSLVGTLARIKERKLLEDGRTLVLIEGIERFYLEEIVAEKPYFKAKVQPFQDYTENNDILEQLEQAVFDEVRTNVRVSIEVFNTFIFAAAFMVILLIYCIVGIVAFGYCY